MNVLMIGDVVAGWGCRFLQKKLPGYKKFAGIDLCIVNGENSADGNGMTPSSAELLFASGADVVVWQPGDKPRLFAIVGKRNSDVCLTAAVNYAELIRLGESEISLRRESEHDLSECYYFCHDQIPFFILVFRSLGQRFARQF